MMLCIENRSEVVLKDMFKNHIYYIVKVIATYISLHFQCQGIHDRDEVEPDSLRRGSIERQPLVWSHIT